jgi:ribosomal protein L29
MSLPKYKDLENLTTVVDIDKEIFLLQKNLFDLRIKKSTSQAVKPHLFAHAKRRLVHLKFKKSFLLKSEN